ERERSWAGPEVQQAIGAGEPAGSRHLGDEFRRVGWPADGVVRGRGAEAAGVHGGRKTPPRRRLRQRLTPRAVHPGTARDPAENFPRRAPATPSIAARASRSLSIPGRSISPALRSV